MTKVAIVYYSGFKGVTEKIAEIIADVDSDEEEEAKDSDTFVIMNEEDNITKAIDDFEVGQELADGATTTSLSSTQRVGRHRRMLPCER